MGDSPLSAEVCEELKEHIMGCSPVEISRSQANLQDYLLFLFIMVHASYFGTLALLCAAALGKEMPVNEAVAEELYDSGIVHERLMAKKMVAIR